MELFSHSNLPEPARLFVDGIFDGDLSACLEDSADVIDGIINKSNVELTLLAQFEKQGFGLTLKRPGFDMWFCILQDPTDNSKVRWSQFDCRGFHSHACFSTAAEAIRDAIDCGAKELADRGTLSRIARGPQWYA